MPLKACRLIASFCEQPAHLVICVLLCRFALYRIAYTLVGAADVTDECPVCALIAIMAEVVNLGPLEFLHGIIIGGQRVPHAINRLHRPHLRCEIPGLSTELHFCRTITRGQGDAGLEPLSGFEPETCWLQISRSTVELRRQTHPGNYHTVHSVPVAIRT